MRVGFVVRNSGVEAITAVRSLPQIAEQSGYSAVWFTDHVIGTSSFLPVYEPDWAEVVTCLAYAAATTERVGIGVGVLVLPYRDPVLTAKMLTTIDNLSDGRLLFGIGAGWSKAEFAALGVFDRHAKRGRVTDETIDLIKKCWEGGELTYTGTEFSFRGINTDPVPVQRPHPPIWVGGQSPAAIRRAARVGDAWHPTNISPDEMAELGPQVDADAGRPVPRTIRLGITLDSIDGLPDRLAAYEAAGCVEAAIGFREHGFAPSRDGVERMAKRLGLV